VLQAIDEDRLQANSDRVGTYLMEGLTKLKGKHDIIGDVRGRGLMVGMELVKDRATKVPAKQETVQVFEKTKEMGLLLGKGGLSGNVFRIKPPMCITTEDIDFMIEVMDEALMKL
jgi:alanine-glyoxylate transaminase/(R)-3-amino-2-methylpropionate-pyruvate transaminase